MVPHRQTLRMPSSSDGAKGAGVLPERSLFPARVLSWQRAGGRSGETPYAQVRMPAKKVAIAYGVRHAKGSIKDNPPVLRPRGCTDKPKFLARTFGQ